MNTTVDKSQKIAHDDRAKPVSVKQCRNGISVRWACGCSIFRYNPDKYGMQAIRYHYCNTEGRQAAKRLIAEAKV